jgi:alpha-L-fucosidase
LKSVAELLDTYEKTVGRGAQLMLGLAPDTRGLLPDSDVQRLAEFGAAVSAIYGPDKNLARDAAITNAAPANDGDPDTFWSAPLDARSATINLAFETPVTIDRALTMEWLGDGQQIQKYAIEALVNGKWTTLYRGTSIGHKKIDKFARTTTDRIRLVIISAAAPPRIREFQLFDGAAAEAALKKQ